MLKTKVVQLCTLALLSSLLCCREAPSSPPATVIQAPPKPAVYRKPALYRMPKEAEVIAGISLIELRNTRLWAKFGDRLLRLAPEPIRKFSKSCGISPIAIAEKVTVAKTADNRYIVVVRTVFSQQEVKKCVSALAIKDLGVSRGLHSYQFDGIGPKINMVWIDKTTFLAGTVSPELMFRVMNEEGTAMAQPRLANFAERIDTNATLWGISLNSEQSTDENPFLEGGRLSIGLKDGLEMQMTMRFYDEDVAANARNGWAVAPASGTLLELLYQDMKVSGEGRDATASVALTAPLLEELVEATEQAWPALEELYWASFPSEAESFSQLEAIMKRHSQSLSDSEGDCKKIIAAGETMVRELRAAGLSEFIADIPADTMAALEEKYKSDEVSQESEDKCWDRDFLDYSSQQRRNLEEKQRSASQPSP